MTLQEFCLLSLRKVYTKINGFPPEGGIDFSAVEFADSEANDFIYDSIKSALDEKRGLSVCKFGSYELATVVGSIMRRKWSMSDFRSFIKGYPIPIFLDKEVEKLATNAGFFPATDDMVARFVNLMLADMADIDILASYICYEKYLADRLSHCRRVNLDGYYAPFLFDRPWTRILENRRVLVVHPFEDSIRRQYARRSELFDNQAVLPEFGSLETIKAVQSVSGTDCGFPDWFAALDCMKEQMDSADYDIALIGCGAYGLPLAVHAKRQGKVAVHLAGWTQMLFGIYGNRWTKHQPQYSKFIKDSWIRPSENEKPSGAAKIEDGCYW